MTPQRVTELVRSTGDVAFAVDDEGVIVAWNSAAEAEFALAERDALGIKCSAILAGIDECGPVCSGECTVRQSALARRAIKNFDLHVDTPDGRRWFNISVLLFSEAGLPVTYAIHIARSIDVRKRLEVLLRDFVRSASSPDLVEAATAGGRPAARNVSLTTRETSVVALLARGLTTDEIASELAISRATVNNHTQRAMSKLDAHTRLEAVRKAVYAGLI